jgi:hypothetical protein
MAAVIRIPVVLDPVARSYQAVGQNLLEMVRFTVSNSERKLCGDSTRRLLVAAADYRESILAD